MTISEFIKKNAAGFAAILGGETEQTARAKERKSLCEEHARLRDLLPAHDRGIATARTALAALEKETTALDSDSAEHGKLKTRITAFSLEVDGEEGLQKKRDRVEEKRKAVEAQIDAFDVATKLAHDRAENATRRINCIEALAAATCAAAVAHIAALDDAAALDVVNGEAKPLGLTPTPGHALLAEIVKAFVVKRGDQAKALYRLAVGENTYAWQDRLWHEASVARALPGLLTAATAILAKRGRCSAEDAAAVVARLDLRIAAASPGEADAAVLLGGKTQSPPPPPDVYGGTKPPHLASA